MTSADKAKQKEATGIVSALVKGATAYQTEYELPVDALDYLNMPIPTMYSNSC